MLVIQCNICLKYSYPDDEECTIIRLKNEDDDIHICRRCMFVYQTIRLHSISGLPK